MNVQFNLRDHYKIGVYHLGVEFSYHSGRSYAFSFNISLLFITIGVYVWRDVYVR